MNQTQNIEVAETNIDKLNPIDQLINNSQFDKAFDEVFGLPESVIQSLGEVS